MDELRAAFDEAFAQDEEDQAASQEQEETTSYEEPEQDTSEELEASAEEATREESTEEPAGEAPEIAPEKSQADAPKKEKAPASWSAKAREDWAKVPPEAQAQVMKREKEINRVLQETAGARQAANELNQVLAPYKDGMIASGVNTPIQAIGQLLATESRLRAGTHQEKALTVANLIKNYGVDIGELDNILSGQGFQPAQQQGGYNSDVERLLEQRLAPVNQFLQQQQYKQQMQVQQEQQAAVQTVESFSANAEFINEVRMDMADLLDMSSARGQSMTIEEAYNKACAINPEVSSVMSQRQKQQQIMGTQNDITRKRNAASSINGHRGGGSTAKPSDSIRDGLLSAWNDQSDNY